MTSEPLPGPGILLGWKTPSPGSFGFAPSSGRLSRREEPLWYRGDGHLITLAPTRSGKGRGAIVPTLLQYPGPMIVFDPKGELYWITARRRRALGQRVVALDPCRVLGPETDALNPLDIFSLEGSDLETDAQTVASWLADGNRSTREAFWDAQGTALHSALIAYVASACPPVVRSLETAFGLLTSDDTIHGLAALLDTEGKTMCQMAYREIASFLQTAEVTRSGILATALSYIKPFLSPRMTAALTNSTFNIHDIVDGAPLTIYMVLPVDKLRSHRALLKMWVGTLLKALTSRRHVPTARTLMLLDEAGQLESFPYLETAITLCAGYGVQCWTFWQDLAQLKTWYPTSWETILNNCEVLQTFGVNNRHLAAQWGDFLDQSPENLLALPRETQVVQVQGRGSVCCRRPDYLTDPLFAGLFDDNPLHSRPQARKDPGPAQTERMARCEANRPTPRGLE